MSAFRFLTTCLIFFTSLEAHSATKPQIHNGKLNPFTLPTKVLECSLPNPISGPNGITSFRNCVNGKLTDYGQDRFSEGKAELQSQMENLQGVIDDITPPAVAQCLANANNAVGNAVQAAKTNPKSFAKKHINDILQAAQSSAAGVMSVSLTQPESSTARLQRFHQAFLSAINQDPVASCVFNLSTNTQNHLVAEGVARSNQLIEQMNQIYKQHFEPQISIAIQQALTGAMKTNQKLYSKALKGTNAAGKNAANLVAASATQASMSAPEEIQLIARGLLSERLLNPGFLNGLSATINKYASEQKAGAVSAQTSQRLAAKLRAAENLSEGIAIELGVRILRHYGHDLIDSAGAPLVELAIEYVRGWKTTGGEAVDVPCATPSTPGGAACAVVWWAVNISADFGAMGLEDTSIKLMHTKYDALLNAYQIAMQNNTNTNALSQQHPMFNSFAQHLPSRDQLVGLLLPEVKTMFDAMTGYHKAVGLLVSAKASPTSRKGR